jgi:hypothetical protein
MEEHEADGEGDEEQVELAGDAGLPGFDAAFGDVDGADGKAGAGAWVAVSAGLGEVGGVDGRFRIGGRKNVVIAVAGGATGDALGSGAGGQTVEGVFEGGDAIGRKAEAAGEAEVAVAAAAGLADSAWGDGGAFGFGAEDGVFPVTIGADGGVRDAGGESLAVYAGLIPFEDFGVAEAAGLGNRLVECGVLGALGLVGLVMTGVTIGRGGVAGGELFAMNGAFVIADLSGMAGDTGRFRQTFRVREISVFGVALGATDGGVGGGGDGLSVVFMAAQAIDFGRGGGLLGGEREKSEESEENGATGGAGQQLSPRPIRCRGAERQRPL